MSTGASSRPTQRRISAIKALICDGDSQLRWKRMNPSGFVSRYRRRSSSVRAVSAQPKMQARGAPIEPLRIHNQTALVDLLERDAGIDCRCAIRERTGLNAIHLAAVLGDLDNGQFEFAQQLG